MRSILLISLLAGCSSANFDVAAPLPDDGTSDSLPVDGLETSSEIGVDSGTRIDDGTDTTSTPPLETGSPIDTGASDTFVPPPDAWTTDTGADAEGPVTCPAFAYDHISHTWPLACIGSSGACFEGFSCACAQPVGRQDAKGSYSWTAAGFSSSPSAFAGSLGDCPKSGPDHAYKLFMRKGESVTAAISVYTSSFGTYLTTFWESRSCTSNTCSSSYGSCGSSVSSTTTTSSTFKATSDGWVTIVVSGKTPSDKGFYNLKLTLSGCAESLCGCG